MNPHQMMMQQQQAAMQQQQQMAMRMQQQQMMYQQQQAMFRQNQKMAYLASQPMPKASWFSRYFSNMNQQAVMQFATWFTAIDTDQGGTLDPQELTRIQFNGRNICLKTASCLIKAFDADSNGHISFWEYVGLHSFVNDLQRAFTAADADRSGRLDNWNEVGTVLQAMQFQLNPALVQELVKKFASPPGGLDFAGLLALGAHLAFLNSLFQWNSKGQPVLTLNFDQFAMLGTHILP